LLDAAEYRRPILAKLILINRYFHPDESASSRVVSSLAFSLAGAGWDVHAATSRQFYNDPLARPAAIDRERGVVIHRLWTTRLGRRSLPGRALDYFTFFASVFLWLIRNAQRGDTIIALTDPPLLSVLSTLAARIKRCRHINWLQDLFPEVAHALGVIPQGPWYRLVLHLRNLSLQHAAMNVAIGERMARHLEQQRVRHDRIAVIHNWTDGSEILPRMPHDNSLRAEWGLADKFIVGYSGNLGRAHDYKTILEAAELLRHDDLVRFLFIGGGHLFEALEEERRRRSLANIILKPYQPQSRLNESLTLPDLHLISLLPSLEGLIVPSKFYGIAAAGRPTIFIGDPAGEIPGILRKADCGVAVAIGDHMSLMRQIKRLQRDAEMCHSWGENARNLLQRHFDRSHAIAQWTRLLEGRGLPLRDVPESPDGSLAPYMAGARHHGEAVATGEHG
jgi:glycosyltransferase involved in cell wall biosynthesis